MAEAQRKRAILARSASTPALCHQRREPKQDLGAPGAGTVGRHLTVDVDVSGAQ